MEFPGLADRLAQVRDTIAGRQAAAGWSHPVTIVAVTKTHGPEAVRAAWAAGLRDVGENRVQEALAKQEQVTDLPVAWHLIGTLQRNKARHAAGRFALIHSVDREDLAAELGRRVASDARQAILVQVNCSGEPQKGGVEPDALPALLEAVAALPRLDLRGLMTMAELTDDPARQRAAFRRLRTLRDEAERRGVRLPELSMGMSGDFAVAVEEGATMVRLGSILFGGRTQ
ncbi:MAG TPA: YggS family pyridoxal phosphate-dependent enzyme [Gemmatimonadales bacterium]|nr:YggS family pyridoxal phosphate-dependent enzyme [Gemmatimonadales bacterium]